MRATKRSATTAAAASVPQKYRKVVSGIQSADWPSQMKDMLVSLLDSSVGVPKCERHSYQAKMVDVVESVLVGVEAGLEKDIAAWEAKVEDVSREKASCNEASEGAQALLNERTDLTNQKKCLLADVTLAFQAAKQVLVDANGAREIACQDLDVAAGKESALALALQDVIQPLQESSAETLGKDTNELLKLLKSHGLDEAMIEALPGAIRKNPDDRGPFDKMVLTQLSEDVNKRLEGLRSTMASGEQTRASHNHSVQLAETDFQKAKLCLLEAANTFTKSQEEQQDARKTLSNFQESVAEAATAEKSSRKSLSTFKASLVKFRGGSLASFVELRDETLPMQAELGA